MGFRTFFAVAVVAAIFGFGTHANAADTAARQAELQAQQPWENVTFIDDSGMKSHLNQVTTFTEKARRHINPDLSVGGWVSESSAVSPTVTISYDSAVYMRSFVLDNAKVLGHSRVLNWATVRHNAVVRNSVLEESEVGDNGIAVDTTLHECGLRDNAFVNGGQHALCIYNGDSLAQGNLLLTGVTLHNDATVLGPVTVVNIDNTKTQPFALIDASLHRRMTIISDGDNPVLPTGIILDADATIATTRGMKVRTFNGLDGNTYYLLLADGKTFLNNGHIVLTFEDWQALTPTLAKALGVEALLNKRMAITIALRDTMDW